MTIFHSHAVISTQARNPFAMLSVVSTPDRVLKPVRGFQQMKMVVVGVRF
ncbi:MAG: hypothetical protein H6537_00125 [Bacteroidales bacterium]|nr:hypothetical protein [Bacteroidales bacterium]